MSDSGSRVANPADLRDASRERLLAEIGLLQHQFSLTEPGQLYAKIIELEKNIDQMKRELADTEMRVLQARDYARGCAAELGEAQANFAIHQQLADRQVIQARKKKSSHLCHTHMENGTLNDASRSDFAPHTQRRLTTSCHCLALSHLSTTPQ